MREARTLLPSARTDRSRVASGRVLPLSLGALVAAAGAGYWLLDPKSADSVRVPRLRRPVQTTAAIGVEHYPTRSPDGRTLAYAATLTEALYGGNWDIWVTQLGLTQPVNRTSDDKGSDRFPAWSPDGTQIALGSDREEGGYVTMSALGGKPGRVVVAYLWSAGARGGPTRPVDRREADHVR